MSLVEFLTAEAQRQGVPVDLALKVANQESRTRQFGKDGSVLTSPAGALGVMQLMPGTARDLGVNPNDPLDNIRGGVAYLKKQLDTFGRPDLALAAYNSGPGRVRQSLARGGSGIPNIAETQNYVRSIQGAGGNRSMDGGSGADIFGGSDAAPGQQSAQASGADIFAAPAQRPEPSAPVRAAPRPAQKATDPRLAKIFQFLDVPDPRGPPSGGRQATAASAAPPKGILEYLQSEVGGAVKGAWNQAARDAADDKRYYAAQAKAGPTPIQRWAPQTVDEWSRTGRQIGDVANLALSPIGGAMHAGVVRPLGSVLSNLFPGSNQAENEKTVSRALMALGPESRAGLVPGRVAVPAAKAAASAPARAPLADYARAQVNPSLAVSGGKTAQMLGQNLAGNAIVGGPLRAAGMRTAEQLAQAVDRTAGRYGGASGSFQAGNALKAGVENGVGRLRAEATAKYNPMKPLEADITPRPLTKTRAALDQAFSQFTTPEMKDWLATKATDLAQIRDVVSKSPGASYAEMKAMRGVVGGMLDDPSLIGTGQNAGLKQLYGALSDDMMTAANSKGLGRQLETADANYARLMANKRAVFDRFFGPNVTEQGAYERMAAMAKTKGAKSSWPQLRTLQQAVGPEQWGEVSSGVLRNMGKTIGEGGQEGFSAAKFATEWDAMSPQARRVLFGGANRGNDLQDLHAIANVARDQQAASKFYNFSQSGNTATNNAAMMAHGAAVAAAATGHVAPLAGILALDGMGLGASKLLSSPGFARFVLKGNAAKTPGAMNALQQSLNRYAQQNPAVAQQVRQYQTALLAGGQVAGETQATYRQATGRTEIP